MTTRIILVSSRNNWNPRIKTPNISRFGFEWILKQLKNEEVDRLLQLTENNSAVNALVEPGFGGFSKQERRRRLIDRCGADMFVCLRNIFASEPFDDIILREHADLPEPNQDIYRHVAAMENAGIRVHRQLVIRLLGVSANSISGTLAGLTDIVYEYTIDEKLGLYGWRCRHLVISSIVNRFKFPDVQKTIDLFNNVIDSISPTYDIEIRTIRDLCNIDTGIPSIPNIETQNRLLRKMMSVAPGERIPRHRLIRNLIEMGAFEKAETEIRLFNKDFGTDGPVHRYKIKLTVARAVRTPGIMPEDRIVILDQAHSLAAVGMERYANNKNLLSACAELGIEFYRLTGKYDYFDEAINALKAAEENTGDTDISKIILKHERRIAGKSFDDGSEYVA